MGYTIYKVSIDTGKINKADIYEDKSGRKWLQVDVVINDIEDQYGKIGSVKQYVKEEKKSNFIGSVKNFKSKENTQPTSIQKDDDLPDFLK